MKPRNSYEITKNDLPLLRLIGNRFAPELVTHFLNYFHFRGYFIMLLTN